MPKTALYNMEGKAIGEVDWRRYGLEQRGGKGIPFGPAIILVHIASLHTMKCLQATIPSS